MILTAMRTSIRTTLADGGTRWSDDEILQAITQAVADLSRFYPKQGVYEVTVDYQITDEHFTSSYDTAVSLANQPIEYNSETIETTDDVTSYTRDTDYTIDYWNGTITVLSTGDMADATAYHATYKKSRIGIDISSITNLIRVVEVFYPVGDIPQAKVSFGIWDDFLFITTTSAAVGDDRSQTRVTEKKHIQVLYWAAHDVPGAAAGSFPRFLDEVIILGATAYCMFIRAVEAETQAKLDLASVRTNLDYLLAIHVLVDTALDRVLTYGEGASDSVKKALQDIGGVITAAETAFGKIDTYLAGGSDSSKAALDSVDAVLGDMDSALDKVTTYTEGATVSSKWALAQIAAILSAMETAMGKVDTYSGASAAGAAVGHADIATQLASIETALDAAATSTAAIDTAMTAVRAVWTDAVKRIEGSGSIIGADVQLQTGDGKISTVNVGADEPELYRRYGETELSIVDRWLAKGEMYIGEGGRQAEAARAYIAEAATRLADVEARMRQVGAYNAISEAFIGEARARLAEADNFIAQSNQFIAITAQLIDEARVRAAIADGWMNQAARYAEMARGFEAEGRARIAEADNYIAQAGRWNELNEAFVSEARARIAEMDAHLAAAAQYANAAAADIALAGQYREDGNNRRSEFWNIIQDKAQLREQTSIVPVIMTR